MSKDAQTLYLIIEEQGKSLWLLFIIYANTIFDICNLF